MPRDAIVEDNFDFTPDRFEVSTVREYRNRDFRSIEDSELLERDTRAVVDRLFQGFGDL